MALDRVGRYEVLEVLGRGAMGVVYLARDPLIDRLVALKTLRVDLDADLAHEFRERFLREARAAGRLNHRSIVTIHDVGEDPATGLVFIAMELVRGRNLKEVVASGQRLRLTEVVRIGAELAEALHYAHLQGVVHRDVKPANVILTEDGTAKVTDFGVARLEASNLTVEGQFVGTPNYMSPEQVAGQPVDGRSDLFSLGVVLFELVTMQRPFRGQSLPEVTHRIVHETPPIPSTLVENLPPAFNPVLLRCLDKDPARRYASGAELAAVLTALGRTLLQREASDGERTELQPPDRGVAAGRGRPRLALSRPRELVARLPLPEFFAWEVSPRWVWSILGTWTALWAAILLLLLAQRDGGPFPTPSPGSIRSLHQAARAAQAAHRLLESGDAEGAAAAAAEVLDQSPGAPGPRRVMAQALRQLDSAPGAGADQRRAAVLLAEGQQLLDQGQLQRAGRRFEEALELDPSSDLARSYLDLVRERVRAAPRARPTPAASVAPGPTPSRAVRPGPATRPTPGSARVTLFFNSPVNAGALLVTLDGETLAEVPFDFTRKGMLGIKRKGSGQVKRVLLLPSGRQTVGVQLVDAERGLLGEATFTEVLPAGTDWTLRADLPGEGQTPSFYLVKATGY